METDAIIMITGGIRQDASLRWVSTDLTADDNELGAPGGKLRVFATAVLGNQYPTAAVVTSGGKGFDVPEGTPEDRPLLAEILRDELIECGVPESRIVLEKNSNTTYQQLQELEKMIAERGWHNVMIITNRYHLPRLHAMIETKFPELANVTKLASAEEVLRETDPARWETAIAEAYASPFMADRMAKEEHGVLQIKNGTYQFH